MTEETSSSFFGLTCHCVSCEVMASGRVFDIEQALCLMIMFYCFIVLYNDVLLCGLNLHVFLVFCLSRHNESCRCFRAALRYSPLPAGKSFCLSRQNFNVTFVEMTGTILYIILKMHEKKRFWLSIFEV